MKTPSALLFSLLFLAASAFAQTPPPASTDALPAITRLREGLISNFNKGDVDGLLQYLDPEVVVTWQNKEVCRGPEQVRAFYNRMMTGDKRIVRDIQSNPEVTGRQVYGDWAVSWGNLHDHFVLTDGSDLPFNSAFTATIAKRGDRWLVVSFHTSVNAFENPILGTVQRKVGLWVGLGGALVGLLVGVVGMAFLRRKRTA